MKKEFKHKALKLSDKKPIIFTALSKKNFYMRFLIVRFVLENDGIPMNPFMAFDYYLADTVDRDIIRNANNNLVAMAEELWVFGDISNGILAEIKQFQKLRRKIRFFKIENDKDFVEIRGRETKMEEDVKTFKHLMENI